MFFCIFSPTKTSLNSPHPRPAAHRQTLDTHHTGMYQHKTHTQNLNTYENMKLTQQRTQHDRHRGNNSRYATAQTRKQTLVTLPLRPSPRERLRHVVSATRRSSGVAPRACVRVYSRVLMPPNIYIFTYYHAVAPVTPCSRAGAAKYLHTHILPCCRSCYTSLPGPGA